MTAAILVGGIAISAIVVLVRTRMGLPATIVVSGVIGFVMMIYEMRWGRSELPRAITILAAMIPLVSVLLVVEVLHRRQMRKVSVVAISTIVFVAMSIAVVDLGFFTWLWVSPRR
jgi:hypothetical protein